MEDKYMKLALEEAIKSIKHDDVPVGAIIVYNNKVIAKAHNKREKNQIVTKHAEIIAIEKACKKLKRWRLNDCEIYITLEPCLMCFGAITQSRINKVIYATENKKESYIKNLKTDVKITKIQNNQLKKEASGLLSAFFKTKRK